MGLIILSALLKNRRARHYLMLFILILALTNCHNEKVDFSVEPDNPLVVEDFLTSINEHPIETAFLGTIETNMEATFILVSESPEGALEIDANTGNISIADDTLFDFETNPLIEAIVNASTLDESAESSITINLNDIDDIAFRLADSKQAYLDAETGNWILITESEYNSLAVNLNAVTILGTTDAQYSDGIQTEPPINAGLTIINNSSVSMIPTGSYVFAFKYHAFANPTQTLPPIENTIVKMTETDIANGYYDLGSTLPAHDEGDRYFVLKGNITPTNAMGYLGVCEAGGMGYKRIEGTNVFSNACASSNFFNEENNQAVGGLVVMYQGLSTTQKQWD